ncbi:MULTISPECIES: hypothetical protein [unclassified Ensifer]|uniref:hypothetical protein n=1 Tax=unclassified Ensifer TaxID=2633371 RepID=UPI000813C6F6|nr:MULTISPECIES: hypothetical protein [unclassified Ensifer]OCP06539.1 hypothetical protein BC374_04800 [Ensifer sp. LC13]OCP06735.1 hypothetical protein BC362_11365 [Ensifer sp. LC14]OCP31221.1 hypothetical protein BC364_05295 [Ensifer sp. LC499]
MGAKSTGKTAAAGAALAVTWFVLLFVVTIVVATVTLSASQLQGRLLAFSRADVPFSVWQIDRLRKQWNTQQDGIAAQSAKIDDLRRQRDEAANKFHELQVKYSAAIDDYNASRDDVVAKLRLYVPLSFPDNVLDMGDQELRAKIDGAIEDLETALHASTKKAVDDLHGIYLASLREKNETLQTAREAEAAAANARGSLEREDAILVEAEKKISKVIDPDGTMKPGDVARIYDLISEFTFIERFALGTLYRFAILPSEFLSIVLVIAMGILGSTVQLTNEYYRDGGIPKSSHFLIRPMLGAIIAIVVFVLLKAGVLVVTDSAKLGEAAPLNPFFIAFVGIVSGLLSENALETVRGVGQTWLRGGTVEQRPRWASGVKSHLSETKTIAELSGKTGIDVQSLERWVEQQAPVPPDMQKLFAVWLDKDVRTLFTDLPPQPAT